MKHFQARLRPEFRLQYPELNLAAWYEVGNSLGHQFLYR